MDWISVEDQMPQRGQACWMMCWYTPFNSFFRTYWNGRLFFKNPDMEHSNEITHWLEIEVPK